MERISLLLKQLGIGQQYRGYQVMVKAVLLAMEDPDRLLRITKTIYPMVAQEIGTSHFCVERNMRTAINHCWLYGNRTFLQKIAGYPLTERPSNGEFLDLLVAHLSR